MKHRLLFGLVAGLVAMPIVADVLKINGSTTVNLPVAEAAENLRVQKQLRIEVDTQGGSAGGVSMLADGQVQIGMISRHLSDQDRQKFPKVAFKSMQIGEDAIAIVVSRDVWEGGIKALTRAQIADIYEGRAKNWSQLGGPDRRIVFFNKEPGRGTWEVFARWLYGDPKKSPQVSFPEVGGNEEARSKVAGTRGAMSQLSSSWADGKNVFALGIKLESGAIVDATRETIDSGTYPLSRPLELITNGDPSGNARIFIDYMLSPAGQALVKKHGYLSLDQLR